jgi:hypothetical protein
MEVEYSLTVEDFLALQRHRTTGPAVNFKRAVKGPSWVSLVALVVLVALLVLLPESSGWWLVLRRLVLVLLGTAAGAVAMLTFFASSVRRLVRKELTDGHNAWALATRRFRIGPDGVEIFGPDHQAWQRWPLIWKVDVTPEYVFFFDTSTRAHIVPRRAFADEGQWEKFLMLVRRYRRGESDGTSDPRTGIISLPDAKPAGDFRRGPAGP